MKGRRMLYLAVAAAAVVAAMVLPGTAGAANIACGATIESSITLDSNLDCSGYGGTAINIAQNGVTLNLGGHTLTGNNSYTVVQADGDCPYGGDCNNVTVTNGTISGGSTQVDLWGTNDTASSLTLTNASSYGVWLDYATSATVTGNLITGAGSYDIYAQNGSSNTITSNIVKDSGSINVYLEYEAGDTVTGNNSTVSGNSSSDNFYDYESDNEVYSGNITAGGNYGYYVEPDGDGIVTMSGNGARGTNYNDGFYLYEAYHWMDSPPQSVISGNISTGNAGRGYYDYFSYGATYLENIANYNAGDGFYFEGPVRQQIIGNLSKYNSASGFYMSIDGQGDGYDPLAFANNDAFYNQSYGFYTTDYTTPGSGNTGNGTNSPADCYDVAGCS